MDDNLNKKVAVLHIFNQIGVEKNMNSSFNQLMKNKPLELAGSYASCPAMLRDFVNHARRRAFLDSDQADEIINKYARGRKRLRDKTFRGRTWKHIRKKFKGKRSKIFQLYVDLKAYHDDPESLEYESLYDEFRTSIKYVRSKIRDKSLKKEMKSRSRTIQRLLRKIDKRWSASPSVYSRISRSYVGLIKALCKWQDIYLKVKLKGHPEWARFRMMSGNEKEMAKLKEEDPELYEMKKEKKELRDKIDKNIQKNIRSNGLEPGKKNIHGKIVNTGKDVRSTLDGGVGSRGYDDEDVWYAPKVSDEIKTAIDNGLDVEIVMNGESHLVKDYNPDGSVILADGIDIEGPQEFQVKVFEELVYEKDGSVKPVDEFIRQRDQEKETYKKLSRVFPEDLDDIRRYEDDLINDYKEEREIEYAALTDDPEKDKAMTRIYPTIEVFGDKVIAEGRFKGAVLDDMVNAAGRMIEGVAYDYDEELGRPVSFETTDDEGDLKVDIPNNADPYVTVDDDGRLHLKIGSGHDYTDKRGQMVELSGVSDHLNHVEGTRRSVFKFDPEEFDKVRDVLKSMSLSKAAMKKIKNHYEEKAKSEQAKAESNLAEYETEKLGGFKPDIELYTKQKQALSWLDYREGNGVLALDTGVGKSVTSIASIQNFKATEEMNEGDEILYVVPSNLRGNIRKEASKFMEDPEEFMKDVLVISYSQFSRKDEDYIDQFFAVIFDEAHELSGGRRTKKVRNASREHPRKILMTATPIEDDIEDARQLVGIANNEDVTSKEFTKKMRNFNKRFTTRIAGRAVGVTNDAVEKQKMQEWVKQNMFYAKKTQIDEYELPPLRRESRPITMPEEIEEEYKDLISEIKNVFEDAVKMYENQDEDVDRDITGLRVKLKGLFTQLNKLSNMPEGIKSPKQEEAESIVHEKIQRQGRTLLWTDDPELAVETAKEMSSRFAGSDHVVGESDRITIWRSGSIIETYTPRKYEFGEEEYTRDNWRLGVMEHVVKPNNSIVTCTLTSAYTTGLNLQEFDTIIHLDRDTWDTQNMSQRTDRAWRNGQENSCQEITLDMVFDDQEDQFDRTLDEIRKMVQEMDEKIFQEVIVESQKQALGKEFQEMEKLQANKIDINRDLVELYASPYLEGYKDRVDDNLNKRS